MKMSRSASFVVANVILAGFSAQARADHPSFTVGDATSGPITTVSATTLPEGVYSLSVRGDITLFDSLSDDELLERSVEISGVHSSDSLSALFAGVAWGAKDNLTIGARLPFISRRGLREAEHGDDEHGEIENLGDSDGIGDLLAYVQYRLRKNEKTRLHISIAGGLEMPTGKTDIVSDSGHLFEAEHQPGSGSWDPVIGVALSRGFGRTALHASAFHTFNTEGTQETALGDLSSFGVALVHRLGGPEGHDHDDGSTHQHGGRIPVDLIVEMNAQLKRDNKIAGAVEQETHERMLLFSPGVRIGLGERGFVFGSVAVPVWQDVGLRDVETDVKASFGAGLSFGR